MSAILNQIEFYFCDLNLIQDTFLKGVIETSNGFVTIDTLMGFVKVKELTENKEEIINALSKSSFLELSEDKQSVKRKTPLPTEEEINKRSLFIKGFGKDATRQEIIDALNKFAQVECIRMNYGRNKEGQFYLGNAFVEFVSEAEKDKFINSKPTFKENPLEFRPRAEKIAQKQKNKKTSQKVEYKIIVSVKVCNRDLKNAIKNNDLLKSNVVKYFVDRPPSSVEEKKHETTHNEDTTKVEDKKEEVTKVEDKKEETTKVEGEKEENKTIQKKEKNKKENDDRTKNAFIAVKVSPDLEKVKEALQQLKFYGKEVVVSECTPEESQAFKSFTIPVKSKPKFFGKKGKRD
ncbi:La ribonucleoprotein, putative [Entamoeba histolytica HM-1:IMSS-B]|uniref:La ribonucleoprotein, putative n=6 Tax=Entamoeba histolytica TaxID=5759 RepID=C4MBD7_ENTH1|nr:La ribonucleoprotein, putative [Entamoeba histolytica HM-1:IMSS]EMD45891.1 La ribonucleoprotein, putative [Entamoeba histolytica KU27]EMH72634.1 La ribonucleoprotein, putative [Entamoeba histolytica HM-1:IMSS-B]EMS12547.1 La ribonucleoprotein [Entamoeba histolytica HM-3:IMSS]ENY62092.1 La ribonucleoprotein, putative [Entamoeba histolytica HM-1:IMSS-A]GAT99287.1 la ribonucleoprotein putative [Entamoeba histolytica]|eukprot:XP_654906.1 La ribonucleoprotein, putative [Entamoeba histolytica HM-1:IMSS]